MAEIIKELLRASEIEERFGFTRGTLLRWEESGQLKPVKTPGGQRRYRSQDLQRIAQGEVYSSPQERPPYMEMGQTALSRWGGSVYEEPLRELRGQAGRKKLREMRINDPVIGAVFFATESALKQARMRVKSASEKAPDKECAEFVESSLNDMNMPWPDIMDNILVMLEQGFSLHEMTYKRRLGPNPPNYTRSPAQSRYFDGRVGWRKWAPRPADSLAPNNEWVFDDTGGIQGCNQAQEDGSVVFIPIERLLLFRTTTVPANTPEGMPIHRTMFSSYYFGKNFQEIEGIGVERDFSGVPIIYLGRGCSLSGPNSDYEIAKEIGKNIRVDEQACVVIPYPKLGTAGDGEGMLVELLSATGQRAHDVGAIIDRYDRLKALSVLAQFIMLGMGKTGSFALSRTQSDLFTLAIGSWLDKIAGVINRIAIPRLLRYNSFSDITGYPEVVFSDVGLPDLEQLSWFVNNLVGRDVIVPDIELERHLRQMARLPDPIESSESGSESGSRGHQRRIETGEAVLLLRRVLLTLKDLPNMQQMTDEQLTALLEPLIEQMRRGIEQDTGISIPNLIPSGGTVVSTKS